MKRTDKNGEKVEDEQNTDTARNRRRIKTLVNFTELKNFQPFNTQINEDLGG